MRLTDESLLEALERTVAAKRLDWPRLEGLVRALQTKSWASEVHLVVGMGSLSLHAASYEEDGFRLPFVGFSLSPDGVSYCTPGSAEDGPSRLCQPDEVEDLIEVYVLRLLNRTST